MAGAQSYWPAPVRCACVSSDILSAARYEVTTCSDYNVASRLIRAVKGMAIVVCGLKVSGASGLDFMAETGRSYGSIPFILVGARPSPSPLPP